MDFNLSVEPLLDFPFRLRCWIQINKPINPATTHKPNIAPKIKFKKKKFSFIETFFLLPINININSDESLDKGTPVGIDTDFEQTSV